ncbi:tripartite tricarboxylate transporter substrate binding protein [Bradyrhizobium sp. LHD-71]|uniref:Bug family tripartite tricarboxylate transporter substrate binding protein n=1 Tax=Bradyrhizobium sp. LHD-71 TaxID=3072141 RepID=UPI00280FA479|nr:tripartite tricarboxylate transporter substrate binding protein [Bradyrhizobium sp. LHD-71]MDQ8728067.1 tripartite tricarboxylate transporter substrate binding protein [Bradyrhizobium sp. LHD-71]
MKVTRRTLLGTLAASLCAGSSLRAFAQDDWPSHLVRLVSPYAAGGASDISLRILAEQLGRGLAQQFIVENKPGAGTRVATEFAARAAPDGYTFLYAAAPYATAEALFGKLNYDRKDLQPVAMAVVAPLFLIVNAQASFKTVQELIAYGKSRPDGLTFASPGAGSQPHLAAELLFRGAGVKGLNVPFRGDAPAYTELLAGRVDATLTAISTALPHIESGKLRVLGVASANRSPIYPQAQTLREQGLPSVIASGWYGFMAPAATPRTIVDRLQTEINRATADPEVKRKLLVQGLEARGSTAAEFGKFIDDETRKWSELIREASLKGE